MNIAISDLCLHLGSVEFNVESAAGMELSPVHKKAWNTFSVPELNFSVKVHFFYFAPNGVFVF